MTGEKFHGVIPSADFDTALKHTGYGWFHYKSIAVCALSVLIMGFQNGLSPYVQPAAQCELNLTTVQMGMLNVCFLVGGTLSCFLWGILADGCGRQKVLFLAHLLNSIVTILCSVVPYSFAFITCRFLNGFFIGAPGSIVFSYMTEFQPQNMRSKVICYCGIFFTVSWLMLPLMAYFILPLTINLSIPSFFLLSPWRLYMIIIALPEIVVTICLWRLPESPKFYLANGEGHKALAVLRVMYAENTGNAPIMFPVRQVTADVDSENDLSDKVECSGKNARLIQKTFRQMKSLFRVPLLKTTVLTCAMMFCNMFGMFGLGLWLPDLFIRFQAFAKLHPNATITVQQLSTMVLEKNVSCVPSFDSSVIESTVAMAVTSIVYNVISSWLSSCVVAKTISLVSMLLGGLASACIYFMRSPLQNLIVACIFQATMITANMSIAGVGVELFPTKINAVAICMIMCAGRLGAALSNIVFGYLIDDHCEVPIAIVAVTVVIGGLLCFFVNKQEDDKETQVAHDSTKL